MPEYKTIYEDRLLVFIDILGWKHACEHPDNFMLQKALEIIHRNAEFHNEPYRNKILNPDATVKTEFEEFPILQANPLFLQVKFGAFSDHFVFSKPANFGGRIFNVSKICLDLLSIGFLTRGAITRGKLYHVDNIVFGPALIEAARIEAEESIFPRILVHKNVIECCEACGHFPELRNMYMIEDYFGSHILNLFNIIGYGQGEYWDRMLVKTIPIDKIWEIVHTQVEHFCTSSSKKQVEKWIYMKKLIEEKIFVIYPLLKEQVNFGSRAKND